MNAKPTKKSLIRFQYFAECDDVKRLPEIAMDESGYTAAECFHVHETYGKMLPCREPVLLSRALNGKEWHGLTVTNLAQDYIDRLLFASEIKSNYPEWVQRDILGRASQLAMKQIGFIPTFVRAGDDFTTHANYNDPIDLFDEGARQMDAAYLNNPEYFNSMRPQPK